MPKLKLFAKIGRLAQSVLHWPSWQSAKEWIFRQVFRLYSVLIAGAPLCAILTLVKKIFGSTASAGPHQVRRILFVKFAEQGSTVLAYPAILRAIEIVGRENVYFVVFEDNRIILDAMEIIPDGNVITIATKSLFGLATGALHLCMQAITVDDVFENVTRICDSVKKRPPSN